jgi:ABC-type amino acid transport substrate-binding protein
MTQTRKWPWLLIVAALAALVALSTGCGGDDEEKQSAAGEQAQKFPTGTTMAKLQQKGEITIGVKFDVPPFGFKNPQTGDVEGFDVDVGKAVAAELGVKPKFIEAISDNRIPFLKQGTVDLILSTMTINAERDQEIDFSEPYYVARGSILVPKDSPIKGIDDLAGKRVCTALGSTYEATLREKAPKSDRKLVDSYSECFELIQNKAVHAVSTDDVILAGMIIQDPNLKLVGEELTIEPYGAGIKEGDKQFQRFVSGVIAKMKADGRWARLYDKWVGRHTNKQQNPPTITLKEAIEMTT